MARDELAVKRLRLAFDNYKRLRRPRTAKALDLDEAEVDLFEEEAYLVGLVDTFLHRGEIPSRGIALDGTIDKRLASGRRTTPQEEQMWREWMHYRKAMIDLALALATASGAQLREWSETSGRS